MQCTRACFVHLDMLCSSIQTKSTCPSTHSFQHQLRGNFQIKVYMEILNTKFALYGSKNKFARTNTVLFPLPEVSTRAVSLIKQALYNMQCRTLSVQCSVQIVPQLYIQLTHLSEVMNFPVRNEGLAWPSSIKKQFVLFDVFLDCFAPQFGFGNPHKPYNSIYKSVWDEYNFFGRMNIRIYLLPQILDE